MNRILFRMNFWGRKGGRCHFLCNICPLLLVNPMSRWQDRGNRSQIPEAQWWSTRHSRWAGGGLLFLLVAFTPPKGKERGWMGLFHGWLTAAARLREPISDTSLPLCASSPCRRDPLPSEHAPVFGSLQRPTAPLTCHYVWSPHVHKLFSLHWQ